MVTIGQYLRPVGAASAGGGVVRPEVFASVRELGEALGLQVHAAPFVRSSFQAGESFAQVSGRWYQASDASASNDPARSLYSVSDAELQ